MFHSLTSVTYLATKLAYFGLRLIGTRSLAMDIQTFDALDDNYMYLIIDKSTNEAAFVDPVNAMIIPDIIKKNNANLTTILTTHHHWDHASGNDRVKQFFPNVKIYGGDDRVLGLTNKIKHNDIIKLGNLDIRCLKTPCHTSGHICYYIDNPDQKAVFTGDTLFLAGCGRFFEGSPAQMHKNLNQYLANLPGETNVYCGHEYTEKNLRFGLTVEPNNENIINKLKKISEMRNSGKKIRTVPGTISEEKLTNVFMRVNVKEVMDHFELNIDESDPITVMQFLRDKKNVF